MAFFVASTRYNRLSIDPQPVPKTDPRRPGFSIFLA
jgi:hypothetical protein